MLRPFAILTAIAIAISAAAGADAPMVAVLDPGNSDRVPLLEAKLAESNLKLVDRAAVDAVLREQQLQAAFGAQGVGERVRLGKLLKADLLVLVRKAPGTAPVLEVMMTETSGGLRLAVQGIPLTNDAAADVRVIQESLQGTLRKYAESIRDVVAVPPFVSQDLTTEHDHLKGAFARIAEQTALDRPGVVAVELAEAQAVARELQLAAPGSGVTRPAPLFLLGEYRNEGQGAARVLNLTLRAERNGKAVGKPAALKVKPGTATAEIVAWAHRTFDAELGVAVRTPSDPRSEAEHLARRARDFSRLGQWEESLALFEASLLLSPHDPGLLADTLEAVSHYLGREQALEPSVEQSRRGLILKRHCLDHLEVLVGTGRTRPSDQVNVKRGINVCYVASPLELSPNFPRHLIVPETEAMRKELVLEQRTRVIPLIPLVAKNYPLSEISLIRRHSQVLPRQEYLVFLAEQVLKLQDLPQARFRTVAYTHEGNASLRSKIGPKFDAYLSKLESEGNAEVKAAVADLRREIEAELRKDLTAPKESTAQGVRFRPLNFKLAGSSKRPVTTTMSFLDGLVAGDGVDLFGSSERLYLMKEKGVLMSLAPEWPGGSRFRPAFFDGKYFWAYATSFSRPGLLVIDPQTEKTWSVSRAEGLPVPVREKVGSGSVSQLLAVPLGPGRVCVAGGFGPAWVALVDFQPDAAPKVRVIHEAREAAKANSRDQWSQTNIAFVPSYMRVLKGPEEVRVLIGRGRAEVNYDDLNRDVLNHPLLVDPKTGVVEVKRSGLTNKSERPDSMASGKDDALYYLDRSNPRGFIHRLEFPGTKQQMLPVKLPDEATVASAWFMFAHDGRLHLIRQKQDDIVRPIGAKVQGSSTLNRRSYWWSLELDGSDFREVGRDFNWVKLVAVSSHYGLVAFHDGDPKQSQTKIISTVEFTKPDTK